MIGYLTVKLICACNRHELPQLARPLRPIARYCALRRSRDNNETVDVFAILPIDLQAKIVRRVANKVAEKRGKLPRYRQYTTSLLENQAMKVIAALNRCGIKALVGKNETTTLRME